METPLQTLGFCRVKLVLDQETVRWGQPVQGACVLVGGQFEERVALVEAVLSLNSSGGTGTWALPGLCPAVWKDLRVPARESIELRFALRVPQEPPLGPQLRVTLIARLPELWGQVRLSELVSTEPAGVYVELAEVAAELTGLQIGDWRRLGGGDGVGVRLRPAAAAAVHSLDGLDLEIYWSKGGFHGELVVDPAGPGLAHSLRDRVGLDRVRYRFRVPAGDPAEARREFERLLRPHIHPHRAHPLPSQAPAASLANLPVAGDGERRGRRDLPRPSNTRDQAEDP